MSLCQRVRLSPDSATKPSLKRLRCRRILGKSPLMSASLSPSTLTAEGGNCSQPSRSSLMEVRMSAYYALIQYTPDPVIGELINIGVVVFGDGRTRFRFLHNWNRVKRFGANITSLKAFAHQAQK